MAGVVFILDCSEDGWRASMVRTVCFLFVAVMLASCDNTGSNHYPQLPQLSVTPVTAGFGTLVTQSEQLVLKLRVENLSSTLVQLDSLEIRTTGSWAVQPGVSDNSFRLELDGVSTIAYTRSDAVAPDSTVPLRISLVSPLNIQPGGSVEIWFYYDTSTTGGGGANLFFQVEISEEGLWFTNLSNGWYFQSANGVILGPSFES
ncbi:MAG: hypothetical protein Q8O95_04495 [bacterium]|nr:hypothetical protein [bacterium]